MPNTVALHRGPYDDQIFQTFQTLLQEGFEVRPHTIYCSAKSVAFDLIITEAVESTLQRNPNGFSEAMRGARLSGLDNTLENRLCDYSGNLADRVFRLYSLGHHTREKLQASGLDFIKSAMLLEALMMRYFKGELKEVEPPEDIPERLALYKELRAFNSGVSGLQPETALAQCDALRKKDVVQIIVEEKSGRLRPMQISLLDESFSKQFNPDLYGNEQEAADPFPQPTTEIVAQTGVPSIPYAIPQTIPIPQSIPQTISQPLAQPTAPSETQLKTDPTQDQATYDDSTMEDLGELMSLLDNWEF